MEGLTNYLKNPLDPPKNTNPICVECGKPVGAIDRTQCTNCKRPVHLRHGTGLRSMPYICKPCRDQGVVSVATHIQNRIIIAEKIFAIPEMQNIINELIND